MKPTDSLPMRSSFFVFAWLRKLYEWVLSLAQSPFGSWALFLVAVAESSFFPIPPDVLLIALTVGAPIRAFWFALICTAGSVLGAMLGYWLGLEFYEKIGQPIIEFYSIHDHYQQVKMLYKEWDALAVGIAGFTPIPYKAFTIAAGAFGINFMTFVLASFLSRGGRFFLCASLIRWLGPRLQGKTDRYFNLLTIILILLVIAGFFILKYAI